jgi:hypothetical protein
LRFVIAWCEHSGLAGSAENGDDEAEHRPPDFWVRQEHLQEPPPKPLHQIRSVLHHLHGANITRPAGPLGRALSPDLFVTLAHLDRGRTAHGRALQLDQDGIPVRVARRGFSTWRLLVRWCESHRARHLLRRASAGGAC